MKLYNSGAYYYNRPVNSSLKYVMKPPACVVKAFSTIDSLAVAPDYKLVCVAYSYRRIDSYHFYNGKFWKHCEPLPSVIYKNLWEGWL